MTEERKKHYWLHRITGGENALKLSHPLLFSREDKLISIGWSYLAAKKPTFLSDVKNGGWNAFERYFVDKPVNRHYLWRFIAEMKKGDIVVVPTWREFSIYEIADDEILTIRDLDYSMLKAWHDEPIAIGDDGYLYDLQKHYLDLGFFRRVNKIEEHLGPRQDYATQPLYSRMKVFQTNVLLKGLENDVDEAIKRKREKNPIDFHNDIQTAIIKKAKKIIDRYIKDKQYEVLVEKYFKAIGAEIEDTSYDKTPATQGDADRIAVFENLKIKIQVQVKKHGNKTKTGVKAIQQIKKYFESHPEEDYDVHLWVITNARRFSKQAQVEAHKDHIRLITGDEFARMILDVGLKHFE